MRFTTPDPLAEKYYAVSPYVYCFNNPVRYVDPTGMDVWEIDEEGRIINRIEDTTQDAFYRVAKDEDGNYQRTYTTDADGNRTDNSISFEYGTVESQKTQTFSPDGKVIDTYDVYRVRGDENGMTLFEFMADHITGSPSQVEIGQAKTGEEGDKGLNFITTSHESRIESSLSYLVYGQLLYGYTIRELNHSHPNSNHASKNDINSKSADLENLRKARKYGLQSGQIPLFKIYHVPTKRYLAY
jgi:hypothetical protein